MTIAPKTLACVRLSADELAEVDRLAKEEDITRSQWMRRVVLAAIRPDLTASPEAVAAVERIQHKPTLTTVAEGPQVTTAAEVPTPPQQRANLLSHDMGGRNNCRRCGIFHAKARHVPCQPK